MVASILEGIVDHGIDLGRMVKTDGTDLFSGYVKVGKDKLPHLTDSVVDAFGRVLDIFERPANMREPEFDVPELKPSRQVELAESQKDTEVEVRPFPKPRINEDIHLEYMADHTRAQYDVMRGSAPRGDADGVHKHVFAHKCMPTSASPCDAEVRLCSECYISIATVRCDSCAVHFCAVCAVKRHSMGLNTTHKLVTSTSGKEARLNVTDSLTGKFSFGDMAAGPSGSFIGNVAKDLTIHMRTGESAYPTYDICSVHPGEPLKFACVKCHLLPVCKVCSEDAHGDGSHKIVEIESAVAEVKELLGECLSAVVRRHNDLSLVLPELHQLSHASNVGLKNATRSVRSEIQRSLDALKLKKSLGLQELHNMQKVGSAALNRMIHASGTLNKYIKGCISQLEAINSMSNPGMALNMFVDLRANFEKLLFTDEEIPDLVLEIPHWKLHSGNVPNLLADKETRINAGLTKIAGLTNYLRATVRDSLKNIEKASGGVVLSKDETQPSCQPYRLAERRSRRPGPALQVPGAENTLDIVTHSELKGIFLRRDSERCSWRQRAVHLCGTKLFVLDSDFHADDVPIESSIDLGAVFIHSFDDEDVLQVTKLQRMGHPNGFEITEHSGQDMRYWLFTCESKNTALLWLTRLRQVAYKMQRDRQVEALSKEEKDAMGEIPVQETAAAASMQALHNANCEPKDTGYVADPAGEQKTCDEDHNPEYIYDTLNFTSVMDSLKKFKNESQSLYKKCFQGEQELQLGPWEVTHATNHSAAFPPSEATSVVAETPVTGRSSTRSFIQGENVSAGRYAMPEERLQRSISYTPSANVFSSDTVSLPETLPKFRYSPEVKSPRSIHKIFSDLARLKRKEKKKCDIFDS